MTPPVPVAVLSAPDLASDPAARRAVKDEVVIVEFATAPGELSSAVGPNRYEVDDALVTGATGDRWVVARAIFDAKYVPLEPARAGLPGRFRNRPVPVLAKRMDAPFAIVRRQTGDRLDGAAGDWLVEYAPGDHGLVAAARFAAVYRLLD